MSQLMKRFSKISKIGSFLFTIYFLACVSFAATAIDNMSGTGTNQDANVTSFTNKAVKVLDMGLYYILYIIPAVGVLIIAYYYLIKISNPKKANEAVENIKTTATAVGVSFGIVAIFKAIVSIMSK